MSQLNQAALDRLIGIGQKACDLQTDPLVGECDPQFTPLVAVVTAVLSSFAETYVFTAASPERDKLVEQQGAIALQRRFVELWTILLLLVGETRLMKPVKKYCQPDQVDAVIDSYRQFLDYSAAHPGWTLRNFVLTDGHEVGKRVTFTYREYRHEQSLAQLATDGDWYWTLED